MKTICLSATTILLLLSTSCSRRVVVQPKAEITKVKIAPRNYKIVNVRGKRYYYWKGKHYRKSKRGYVYVRL